MDAQTTDGQHSRELYVLVDIAMTIHLLWAITRNSGYAVLKYFYERRTSHGIRMKYVKILAHRKLHLHELQEITF